MQDKSSQPTQQNKTKTYEAPAIIYEGDISTRAGSAIVGDAPDAGDAGVDLFGD